MNRSMEYLNKLLNDDDTVVLGVSGGPDSMSLLRALIKLREKFNIKLVVAHVNHMIREEAIEDEKYVQNYCLKHNIKFFVSFFILSHY